MLSLLSFLFVAPLQSEAHTLEADIAWIAEGRFCEPETVLPLPDDTLLVSNVCDFRATGNGFLTLLDKDGDAIDWRVVEDLDAPLGMVLHNDLVYVVDNNRVKTFRWPGFEPVSTIALETEVANDLAVGPDDSIYVTDSARGEVVVVGPGLEQSVLTGEPQFPGANGIHIDNDDLWVGGGRLWHVDLRDGVVTAVEPAWLGGIDGIEQEPDGTLQLTPVGGPLIRLSEPIEIHKGEGVSSANHGYAPNLGLALIPTGFDNTVIAIRVSRDHPVETLGGYQWQRLQDGIFLHAPIDPLAAPIDGNSMIIDIGDSVVVVDTHINPAAARAAIAQIDKQIGKPVTHIINTHWHDDHTNGNHAYREAWPDAKIIAHAATLEALRKEWQALEDGRREAYAQVEVEQIYAAADQLDDPLQAINYRKYAQYIEALKPELPTLELVYPDTVFEDDFVIDGGNRRIEIRWLGRGNTDGDVVVHLPDDDVLITGDLLVLPVPFAFDSPMSEWVTTLETLAGIGAGTIVPGHGPVQKDDNKINQLRDLIKATLTRVQAAHDGGTTFAELPDVVDLSVFEQRYVNGDDERLVAWQSFFVSPGLKSAWSSLGYVVPEEATD